MFLSDDFSSTIDLDEEFPPVARLPPSKKRRLTPESTSPAARVPAPRAYHTGRSVSDVASLSAQTARSETQPRACALRRSKTSVIDEDPITFTSSPDYTRPTKRNTQRRLPSELSDPFEEPLLPEEPEGHKEPAKRSAPRLSPVGRRNPSGEPLPTKNKGKASVFDVLDSSDDDDLPELDKIASQPYKPVSFSRQTSTATTSASLASQRTASTASTASATAKPKRITKSAEEKAAEKAAAAEVRRLAKEEKVREKEIAAALAAANTKRTDKKVSTPEMIVYLPEDMAPSLLGQARAFLGKLEVEHRGWISPVPNVVKWKRKVTARWNTEMQHWEPCPQTIEEEKHMLVYVPASHFVELATGDEGNDLDAHVKRVKSAFEGCKVIYLIEGLTTWMKKNRNVRNRQYTAAVLAQIPNADTPTSTADGAPKRRTRTKPPPQYIDEDLIEDALLRLQVHYGTLIHHTTAPIQSAEQIATFTQHISTVPYRLQSLSHDAAFSMESGQVRTGTDAKDTYVRMLMEINRVTAPIAWGIALEYPSVLELFKGLRTDGREALTTVRKVANRDGQAIDKEIGKALSRRVHGIFMGTDPGSTDV
jgi:crossover junction endonuclease EME1